jgi:MoaA/NifB/PqqE/SkfB family radical SAM enzyme
MCTNSVDGQSLGGGCFDFATLHEHVDRNKVKWHEVDSVYITGGETTMRPDFFDSLSYIAESFPLAKISILSNGRRFFYADFTKKCLSYSSVDFIIPIHGWNNKSHDKITGIPGSFNQTIGGLENLFSMRDPGQLIEIRVIIHKINYKKINKILDLILKKFPAVDKLVLVFIEYEGHAIKNLKSVELNYDKFYPQFEKFEKYLKKFKDMRFYHFPLCVIPKNFWPYMWRTLDADELSFLPKCSKCKVKSFCMGIHKNYLNLFGGDEFNPLKNIIKIKKDKYNYSYHPIASVE